MRPVLPLLFTVACASAVRRDFEATWDEVMLPQSAPAGAWQPDATVRLGSQTVERLTSAALEAARPETVLDLRLFVLEADLRATRLTVLSPPADCEDCFTVGGTLVGGLTYKGMGAAGSADLSASVIVDSHLALEPEAEGHALVAEVADVRGVSITLGSRHRQLIDLARGPLVDWVTGVVGRTLPRLRVARFGTAGLPLRAMTLDADEGSILLSLRTDAPAPRSAAGDPPPTTDGWSARLAIDSLLAMARREALRAGPLAHGVYVDPRTLDVDAEEFTLGLRLWHPEGGAWWRDYEVVGAFELAGGRLTLRAFEAHEIDRSPNAGLADPLVALARGRILEAMQDAIAASLPSSRTQDVGGVRTTWRIGAITQEAEDLVVTGKVDVDVVAR